MFNGSFLSSSFRVFFPLLSRVPALLVATTLTRDGGGCSGGHVIYLSPYYPPPPCARVSAFSIPLFTSYLLQQLHRVAPSWALPLSPPLRPSFLLSRSASVVVVVSIARGNRDSLPPFLRRCYSLFLLFFVSFLSTSVPLSRSVRPHLSFFLSALFSSFFHYFFFILTGSVEYFGNYSGRFRLFFHRGTFRARIIRPFPFAFCLRFSINKCEKPTNECDVGFLLLLSV